MSATPQTTVPAETQVFVASTVYGLATVVAAMDDGLFPAARRRILVLSTNSGNPETANPLSAVGGFDLLTKDFDAVFSYNDAVAPQHPSEWMPRGVDIPLWDRYFRTCWAIADDPVRLVVESIHVRPAAALCQIFFDALIDVYADGLMSYGPTRSPLPTLVGTRLDRLLHLDLVPGLRPVLLSEWGIQQQVINGEAFRGVLGSVAGHAPVSLATDRPIALLLGQFLSALGLLTEAEEADLHRQMLRAAVAHGSRRLVFKPHPSAGRDLADPMVAEAAALGVELVVYSEPVLAETLYERASVELVVGCFSTAMLTALTCYGIPTVRVGTELLLERLRPYENSNRIPVTIVDAVVPAGGVVDEGGGDEAGLDEGGIGGGVVHRAGVDGGGVEDWNRLLRTVAYCMQPRIYPDLRELAEEVLREEYPSLWRYFKRRRLTALELPGKLPTKEPAPPPPRRPHSLRRDVRRTVRRRLPVPLVAALRRLRV